MTKGAVFSGTGVVSKKGKYRYSLWRIWDENKPLALFIGLNPSLADDCKDDRTISKLIKYAHLWELGGFYIGNLFAYITPYPKELKKETCPIGDENDTYLLEMASKSEKIVCIWGNDGAMLNRNVVVSSFFDKKYCLGKTKTDQPKHPLYLSANLNPIEYI